MTSHKSAVDALEAAFATIRRQAERDPEFAAELVSSLKIPVEIHIDGPQGVQGAMLFLDPVVVAGKGLDEFLRERIVYFRAQSPHYYIHYVRVWLEADVPNLLHNLQARHDFTRGTDQMLEQEEFFRGEIERRSGPRRFVPASVDFQILHPQLFSLRRRRAPEPRAHPREQF